MCGLGPVVPEGVGCAGGVCRALSASAPSSSTRRRPAPAADHLAEHSSAPWSVRSRTPWHVCAVCAKTSPRLSPCALSAHVPHAASLSPFRADWLGWVWVARPPGRANRACQIWQLKVGLPPPWTRGASSPESSRLAHGRWFGLLSPHPADGHLRFTLELVEPRRAAPPPVSRTPHPTHRASPSARPPVARQSAGRF